jgi:hypothetical protein
MKSLVVAFAAITMTASVSLAAENGPLTLTDNQMDAVSAGQPNNSPSGLVVIDDTTVGVAVPVNAAVNVCALVRRCTPTTTATGDEINIINLPQGLQGGR